MEKRQKFKHLGVEFWSTKQAMLFHKAFLESDFEKANEMIQVKEEDLAYLSIDDIDDNIKRQVYLSKFSVEPARSKFTGPLMGHVDDPVLLDVLQELKEEV